MAISDIVPFRWGGLRRIDDDRAFETFRAEMEALHRNIDRAFGNVFGGQSLLSDTWASRDVVPSIDVTEDDKSFNVTVELPAHERVRHRANAQMPDVCFEIARNGLTIEYDPALVDDSKLLEIMCRYGVFAEASSPQLNGKLVGG